MLLCMILLKGVSIVTKNCMKGLHEISTNKLRTCVCNLVFTTSKGVVNKAAVDPASPPQTNCRDGKIALAYPA